MGYGRRNRQGHSRKQGAEPQGPQLFQGELHAKAVDDYGRDNEPYQQVRQGLAALLRDFSTLEQSESHEHIYRHGQGLLKYYAGGFHLQVLPK